MISWTDEAIEAALDAWQSRKSSSWMDDMRAALDAAVKAQGCPKLPDCKTYADRAYAEGRAEALEEAARVAETNAESDLAYGRRYRDEYHKMEQRAHRGRTIAAAIRALKEAKG